MNEDRRPVIPATPFAQAEECDVQSIASGVWSKTWVGEVVFEDPRLGPGYHISSCDHWHRSEAAAMACARKMLRRDFSEPLT